MSGEQHLARIDVLRGVAILMVLAFHSWGVAFGQDQIDWGRLLTGTLTTPDPAFLLTYPLRFGNHGVSLFFVISGYVIHRSYLRDRQFTWRGYASRRFWRIYPAYILTLLVFAIWQNRERTRDFELHALLIHNISARTFFGINWSLWSLAVEVQLYLLYPLAVAARRYGSAGGMLALGIAASIVWRLVTAVTVEAPSVQTYHIWLSPVALWPDWLLGAFLADRHAEGRRGFHRPLLWTGVGVTLTVLAEVIQPLRAVQFSTASLAAAAILELYLFRPGNPGRCSHAVAWVGMCSYSLYLIHQPFMPIWNNQLKAWGFEHPLARLAGFVPYCLTAIALAWLCYLTIELGGLRLGRWVSRRRKV